MASLPPGRFRKALSPGWAIRWIRSSRTIVSAQCQPLLRGHVFKYSYLNGRNERVLCWDHGRFVNHCCAASCLSPGFDFEIATRDILPGDEITDDYGTLNLEEPFACLCGSPRCRGSVCPDDPLRHAEEWDALTASAFPRIAKVEQPLWELVREKDEVAKVLSGELALPSVLNHYYLVGDRG